MPQADLEEELWPDQPQDVEGRGWLGSSITRRKGGKKVTKEKETVFRFAAGVGATRRPSNLAFLWVLCLIFASCSQKEVPTDARLILRDNDIKRINQGLAQGSFVFVIPTRAEGKPTTCPKPTQPSCIWICTGTDPLDGIDDQTCSTNRYCCHGCGEGGADVCQDGA